MVTAVATSLQQERIVPHYLSISSDDEGEMMQSDPGKEWRLQPPPHPNDSICNPHSPKRRGHPRKKTDVEATVQGLETSTQLTHWWTKIVRRRNIRQTCKDALAGSRQFDTREIERPRRLVQTIKLSELEVFEEDEELAEPRKPPDKLHQVAVSRFPERKEDPERAEQRKPPDKLPKTLNKRGHSKWRLMRQRCEG